MSCKFIIDSFILATLKKSVNNNLNKCIRFIFAVFYISLKALLVDFGTTRWVVVRLSSSLGARIAVKVFFGSLSLSLSPYRSCTVSCGAELYAWTLSSLTSSAALKERACLQLLPDDCEPLVPGSSSFLWVSFCEFLPLLAFLSLSHALA